MPDIHLDPAVRTALGPAMAARVLSGTPTTCVRCKTPLPATGRVNAIVAVRGTYQHASYAHPECVDSQLLELPADAVLPNTEPEGANMSVSAGLIDHGGAELPVLVAELDADAYTQDQPGGELVNLLTAEMLRRGFTLMTRMRQAPAPVTGWAAALQDPAAEVSGLAILDPAGAFFYNGTVVLPPGWSAAVARYGWCVLYVGPVGFTALPAADTAGRRRALQRSAQAGHLVGARVPTGTLPR
jgi:hypothetical protein